MALEFTKSAIPAVGRPAGEPSEYAPVVKQLDADRAHSLAVTVKTGDDATALVLTLRNDARKLGLNLTVRSKIRTGEKGTLVTVWAVDKIVHKPKDPAEVPTSEPKA